jgi:hypothetical protein
VTAADPKWDWQDDGTGPMHIRPINDLIEHEWADCVCLPSPQLVDTDHGDGWMYIHHSLDGREKSE